MAEIFGAVGTGISLAHLSAKGLRAFSRFRKDAIGADEEIARLSRDLERRLAILEKAYDELHQFEVRGSGISLDCIGACAKEIEALKKILAVFEENLADGKSWWKLLKTRMRFAWKKEEVNELRENMRRANELFTTALNVCQLYLAKAAKKEVQRISGNVDSIRSDDIPRMSAAITASVASHACGVMGVVITEAQETRASVRESRSELAAAVRELTQVTQYLIGRAPNQINAPPSMESWSEGSSSTLSQSSSSAGAGFETRVYPITRQIIIRRTGISLPLGIASLGLKKERRKRVLTQKNKSPQDTDVTVDEEASYILTVVANFWILRKTVTSCNWKLFSPKISRRHKNHVAFDFWRIADNVQDVIEFFKEGTLMINDVDEDGNSLLHMATQAQSYDLCLWLVDNGADPHATNDRLETALFWVLTSSPFWTTRARDVSQPLLHLLVDKCQLDPNDMNKDGKTVLDGSGVGVFDCGIEQFARLFRRSLELSTEPEKNRIKHLFHSIATGSSWALTRLKYLLDEYRKAGFDQEESAGQKWWYTTDFLWHLVLEDDPEESWALEEILNTVSAGVDLHALREGQTLLDDLLAGCRRYNGSSMYREKALLLRWLKSVHKLGTMTVRDYLKEEERLHPHGVLIGGYTLWIIGQKWYSHGQLCRLGEFHSHGEYPIFMVNYKQSSDIVTLTRGQLMLDLEVVDDRVPGAWICDRENEYCERHGLMLEHRRVGDKDESGTILVIASNPPIAGDDRNVSRWQLPDGRSGQLYDLWTISTAGFEDGDYTLETAARFERDYALNPLYIEYPECWLAIGHFHDPQSEDEDCNSDCERVGSSSRYHRGGISRPLPPCSVPIFTL